MRREAVVDVVTRLFAATYAGRTVPGESDYITYGEALQGIAGPEGGDDADDWLALEAVREVVRNVDLANRTRPSPALVIEAAHAILRRQRADTPALGEGGTVASPEVSAEWLTRLRKQVREASGPLARDLGRAVPKAEES